MDDLIVGDPEMCVHLMFDDGEEELLWVPQTEVNTGITFSREHPNSINSAPYTGKSYYIWVRIYNKSNYDAKNVEVKFYHASQNSADIRDNMELIGTSFANVVAEPVGGNDNRRKGLNVLCIKPWIASVGDYPHISSKIWVELSHRFSADTSSLQKFSAVHNNIGCLDVMRLREIVDSRYCDENWPIFKERLIKS